MTDTAQGGPIYTRVEEGTVLDPRSRDGVHASLDAIFPMTGKPFIRTINHGSPTQHVRVAEDPHTSPDSAGDPEESADPGPKVFTTHDGDLHDAEPFRAVENPSDLSLDDGQEDLPSGSVNKFITEAGVVIDRTFSDEWTDRKSPPVHGEDAKPQAEWHVERCSMGGSVSVH